VVEGGALENAQQEDPVEQRIVECVPNFSEGRDQAKIKQITQAIEAVQGVKILDVDPGADTHRTVVTFVGDPDSVAEAAFQAISRAAQVIDMSTHKGAHPRMGATDVCPFVPVSGITLQECAELSRKVAQRVAAELDIPVFLYEAAASRPERKNLANIRKGEYEGLAEKLKDPEWKPDFGAAKFNAKSGATVMGAREFLVAYNVTLNTRDKALASDIALELREKGRVARRGNITPTYSRGKIIFYEEGKFPCGNCDFDGKTYAETEAHCQEKHGYNLTDLLRVNDLNPPAVVGQKVYRAGRFQFAKSIGWYVDAYKRAQISINLTNPRETPPHLVLEEARRLANERGVVVTGSEVVGVIPFHALYAAGQHYLRAQGKSPFVPVNDVLETAVFSMGLADVAPFDIKTKVLGLPSHSPKALVNLTVREFADEVSRDSPAPGGGSMAALAGGLGAALSSMVANLWYGKMDSDEKDRALLGLGEQAQRLKDQLLAAVDEDANAFNAYMDARRLPQVTPQEKTARDDAMLVGLKKAVEVPLSTATQSLKAMETAEVAARNGNPNSITDAAVACAMAHAGVRGGVWNVAINLKDITDQAFVADMKARCDTLLAQADGVFKRTSTYVDEQLAAQLKKK
jgi:glutamate formiminotransferase/formiminotetrahydrofolate cyclodeaminase